MELNIAELLSISIGIFCVAAGLFQKHISKQVFKASYQDSCLISDPAEAAHEDMNQAES